MNYLAHIFLSGDDPKLLIGNLLGDMIRNKEVEKLRPELQEGVRMHRDIDSFTDKHPAIREINTVFRSNQGKYAPVVTDIILDYVLANQWSSYCEIEFKQFCNQTYDIIDTHYPIIPNQAQKRLASMINGKWLHSYRKEKGIRYAFSRLALRARFDNKFDLAFDTYEGNKSFIDERFNEFFPSAIEMVNSSYYPSK